jgi:hypothetical protein
VAAVLLHTTAAWQLTLSKYVKGCSVHTLRCRSQLRPVGALPQLLVSHKQSNIEIRRVEMDSLRGLNWLNDEIMNVYVNLLQVSIRPRIDRAVFAYCSTNGGCSDA